MDVLVVGAQKPFLTGGAELHQQALVDALQAAGHRSELVRVPVAWEKDRLFDAPLACRLLPLDADLVIATNFPSYFVKHPRKVVWLLHQHRGAYDAADAPWSDFGLDDIAVDRQRLLIEWDTRALEEAERVYTTSGVVSDRLARYNGLASRPLAHPPPLADRLRPGTYGTTVLTAGRLDENKRPELTVRAMQHVTAPVRAVLAGRGVLADQLAAEVGERGLAERVTLAGFVPDAELVELFADALAVLYAPQDEDYGYTTLQAFLAAKPVVTSADAGGVLEWVEHEVTGLVTDGSAEQLGAAVQRLATEPGLAERLGQAGRARVAGLAWRPVVDELVYGRP